MIFGCVAITSAQQNRKEKKFKKEETITKELEFTRSSLDNILVIDNINGSIDVEAYSGNTIQIEVIKTVFADTQEDLQQGIKEIGIKSATKDDAVYVYLDSPYSHFDKETGIFEYREYRVTFNYNYNFNLSSRRNYKHRKKRMYSYRLDFKVKVPRNVSIDVKTINQGNITVKDVQGKLLIVRNINGSIDMTNVAGQTDVNALNKDINITYAKNPTEESWYKSLNGDINLKFKDDLDVSISYKSMNGDFYTDFDVEKTTPKLSKTTEVKGRKIKYKINSKNHFKIGKGTIPLHFDQLNGNTTIKK